MVNFKNKFAFEPLKVDKRIYFIEAEMHPLRLVVTFKRVNNWGGSFLKHL
jgi:hypothetical protein